MIIDDKEIGVRFGVKGDEDFKKWCEEKKRMIRVDTIEECKNLCRSMGNNTYFTDDWLRSFIQKMEQLKENKNE